MNNIATLLVPLALGFMGSLHCIGMCGPIALALPIGRYSPTGKVAAIMLYNVGRIFTYSMLGFLFGMIGRGFSIIGWQQAISVILGASIILVVILPSRITGRVESSLLRIPFLAAVRRYMQGLFRKATFSSFLLIGILNGLLPCGFIYMALPMAVATGSAVQGGLFLALFGAGTIPAMMIVAFGSRLVSAGVRSKARKILPVFMLILGSMLILRGMNLGVAYLSPGFDKTGHMTHSCCKGPHKKCD